MTVLDFIRQFIKVRTDISNDRLWQEIEAIAAQLNVDLNNIDQAYAQLIAEEVDKNATDLAAPVEQTGAIAIPSKKQKKGKIQPASNQQQVQGLKPAVQNLRVSVENQSEELYRVIDSKAGQVEDYQVERIIGRCKKINPNIIGKVSQELEGYAEESQLFLGEIGSVFDEAFAGIINSAS
jgi:hypothetical protein